MDDWWTSTSPSSDLDRGSSFKILFLSELLQLARDIPERYDTSINVDELAIVLGFVRVWHKISPVSLMEASSIQEVLDILLP